MKYLFWTLLKGALCIFGEMDILSEERDLQWLISLCPDKLNKQYPFVFVRDKK